MNTQWFVQLKTDGVAAVSMTEMKTNMTVGLNNTTISLKLNEKCLSVKILT